MFTNLFRSGFIIANLFSSLCIDLRAETTAMGIFEGRSDIGNLARPGKSGFNESTGSYSITSGGKNMWYAEDELHFVWKKVDGDISLTANVALPKSSGDPHRKGCLLIRQSLDTNSTYADAVLHGDGLCSIQYRQSTGDNTHEIQSAVSAPKRIRIEKHGEYVSMSIGESDKSLKPAGGCARIHFETPFYVGLGVCSHDLEREETAIFSDVKLEKLAASTESKTTESTLEFISIQSTDRRVVYHTSDHIEAPNWTPDGVNLIYNSRGSLYRIPVAGGEPTKIDCGNLSRLNNDHGISPDGMRLVISDQTQPGGSRIYTLPIEGGLPTLVTELAPSYWHGWSPDGTKLAYCGKRDNDFDIYTTSVNGGIETRLTTAPGLDDGPEYTPDGQKIFFNSMRSGSMQIWSMNADGTDQQPKTSDEFNNWFPHPSPDGRWIVFLSYEKGVVDHPANKDVELRLMSTQDGNIKSIARLYGGQGTINVPSWSPDSKRVAFVSYQPKYEAINTPKISP